MDLLPFGQLPPYKPRRFVPAVVDWSDWNQVAPLFDALEKRGGSLRTLAEMETWLQDNIPVPGETYRQFVKYLYQQNLLVKGRLPIGKHIVKLDHITCPVLNLIAGEDDLVPCAQSVPFTDCVGSKDRQTIVLKGTGHIGLAIGGRAQQELWPQACAWLAKRDK